MICQKPDTPKNHRQGQTLVTLGSGSSNDNNPADSFNLLYKVNIFSNVCM